MYDLLAWLEASALGHAIRGAGVWAYGVINLVHILGIATLFGSILVLDLRLLGVWRRIPLAAIATSAVPVAATGFCIAALSGLCLITTNATQYLGNPFLLIKFPAIAIGLINVAVVRRLLPRRHGEVHEHDAHHRRQLAITGGVSLVSWLTAITAGRMIGYW